MTDENLKEIISEVIKAVIVLRVLKTEEDTEEVGSKITFKGHKTDTKKTINVTINKDNEVKIDGDAPFLEVVQKAVEEYISSVNS